MIYSYIDFQKAKPFIAETYAKFSVPSVLYKYRKWGDLYHKRMLTDRELFLAPPDHLNDPFDIAHAVEFDLSILESPTFLEYLEAAAVSELGIHPGRDARIIAQNKLDERKKDPIEYLHSRYEYMVQSDLYNKHLGVYCLSTEKNNQKLWGLYTDSYVGFCCGFDTMGLTELFKTSVRAVEYTDQIPKVRVIGQTHEEFLNLMHRKGLLWQDEKEYRFFRVVEPEEDRRFVYKAEDLKELIIGHKTPLAEINKIKSLTNESFPECKLMMTKPNFRTKSLDLISL